MKINFLSFLSLQNSKISYLTGNKLGYEWWWASFIGINKKTNEYKPFFVEYYLMNPRIAKKKTLKPIPSYFMVKSGTYGYDANEINNFYDMKDVLLDENTMNIQHVNNYFNANETYISGFVNGSNNDFLFNDKINNNYMEWNLTVNKKKSYDLGYPTSKLFRKLNFAQMYWHIPGLYTEYNGTILYNNETYNVISDLSYGYQDKNWGTRLTPKWVWLNCNNFIDENGNKLNSSIAIGGSIPVIFNVKFFETLIIIFYHNNNKYEFNFSKFWQIMNQKINIYKDDKYIYYNINATNSKANLKINFKCDIKKMFLVNYQEFDGLVSHKELYNGHHAFGTITINNQTIYGELGGCEYGVK